MSLDPQGCTSNLISSGDRVTSTMQATAATRARRPEQAIGNDHDGQEADNP
jgi:hypothetical protein